MGFALVQPAWPAWLTLALLMLLVRAGGRMPKVLEAGLAFLRLPEYKHFGGFNEMLIKTQERAAMEFIFDLNAWHFWMILGITLVIAEVIGTEFVLLALGAAALATGLLTAAFDFGLDGQLVTAAVAAALFVPAFIRFYRRRFKATGAKVVVSEGLYRDTELVIEEYGGRPGIRIQGDFFPARSTEGDPLRQGELVRVLELSGLTAIVERI